MESVKDASHLYEVERRAEHAARSGFRITELQISAGEGSDRKERRPQSTTLIASTGGFNE